MDTAVTRILIVGGGTAGWLTACRLAAAAAPGELQITLVESPDVATIGVGEGTWPTMRRTLERIGISESEFLVACDASFKQGSRFDGWKTGAVDDRYYHPFVAPPPLPPRDLIEGWQAADTSAPFAETVCAQPRACALDLAPRQRSMPDYAGALNYAYHLDAAKLAALLTEHATQRLGVAHVRDHVTEIAMAENGDVAAVRTREQGDLEADLFIDCTGHAALLIGERYGTPFIDRSKHLFNDRALAVQVPVAEGSPIASQTIGTAHSAGWLWDIGLPTRRGIGCVYSSAHMSDEDAASTLEAYVRQTGASLDGLSPRQLMFRSGHRAEFWRNNCVAVGLSAGFLEPLEASAIVLVELSIDALIDNFPVTRDAMDAQSRRFNRLFSYRWDRIVDFLKLHYALSERTEPYWIENREAASIPGSLSDLLQVWRDQPPSSYDFPEVDEVFPAASYQYVLYGMGFPPPPPASVRDGRRADTAAHFRQLSERARGVVSALPTNRAYLDALRQSREIPAEAAE